MCDYVADVINSAISALPVHLTKLVVMMLSVRFVYILRIIISHWVIVNNVAVSTYCPPKKTKKKLKNVKKTRDHLIVYVCVLCVCT